ncbi:Uncharacterised protein g3276 [Pycnogonum litorale]
MVMTILFLTKMGMFLQFTLSGGTPGWSSCVTTCKVNNKIRRVKILCYRECNDACYFVCDLFSKINIGLDCNCRPKCVKTCTFKHITKAYVDYCDIAERKYYCDKELELEILKSKVGR